MRDELSGERTVVLVACVGGKLSVPAPAKDLYQSPWFRKARVYAERTGDLWYILSAEHHLLHPEREVSPYERSLLDMSVHARRMWGAIVGEQLRAVTRTTDHLVVLAGLYYRKQLLPRILPFVADIAVPLAGLGIGQQLRWLGRANQGEVPMFLTQQGSA